MHQISLLIAILKLSLLISPLNKKAYDLIISSDCTKTQALALQTEDLILLKKLNDLKVVDAQSFYALFTC